MAAHTTKGVNEHHCAPLCNAICHCPIADVRRLLQAGASPHGCGCGNWQTDTRPLVLAMQLHRLDVLQELLTFRANVNGLKYDRQTPLQWAISSNDPHLVHVLLLNGASPNGTCDGCSMAPLELAITSYTNPLLVRQLCMAGADRRSALMFATLCENAPAVSELLALGERHCRLEAEMAARLGKEGILAKILAAGVPPDAGLLLEATRAFIELKICGGIIGVMAKAGAQASPSAEEAFLAVKLRSAPALKQVLALPGANPNATNAEGSTLLSVAAANMDVPCSRELILRGAIIGVPEILAAGGSSASACLATTDRSEYLAGLLLRTQPEVFKAVCQLPAVKVMLNQAITAVCGPGITDSKEMLDRVMASRLNCVDLRAVDCIMHEITKDRNDLKALRLTSLAMRDFVTSNLQELNVKLSPTAISALMMEGAGQQHHQQQQKRQRICSSSRGMDLQRCRSLSISFRRTDGTVGQDRTIRLVRLVRMRLEEDTSPAPLSFLSAMCLRGISSSRLSGIRRLELTAPSYAATELLQAAMPLGGALPGVRELLIQPDTMQSSSPHIATAMAALSSMFPGLHSLTVGGYSQVPGLEAFCGKPLRHLQVGLDGASGFLASGHAATLCHILPQLSHLKLRLRGMQPSRWGQDVLVPPATAPADEHYQVMGPLHTEQLSGLRQLLGALSDQRVDLEGVLLHQGWYSSTFLGATIQARNGSIAEVTVDRTDTQSLEYLASALVPPLLARGHRLPRLHIKTLDNCIDDDDLLEEVLSDRRHQPTRQLLGLCDSIQLDRWVQDLRYVPTEEMVNGMARTGLWPSLLDWIVSVRLSPAPACPGGKAAPSPQPSLVTGTKVSLMAAANAWQAAQPWRPEEAAGACSGDQVILLTRKQWSQEKAWLPVDAEVYEFQGATPLTFVCGPLDCLLEEHRSEQHSLASWLAKQEEVRVYPVSCSGMTAPRLWRQHIGDVVQALWDSPVTPMSKACALNMLVAAAFKADGCLETMDPQHMSVSRSHATGNSNYAAALRLYDRLATTADSATREQLQGQMADLARKAPAPKGPPKHVNLYPELDDPDFVEKLLAKREFRSAGADRSKSCGEQQQPDTEVSGFKLTPSQKFLRNLVSPQTPYKGVLVFHGVGTGKTCAAVQIAESFRGVHTKRVLVLTPPSLKENFQRQIHDPAAGAAQCTGDTYKGKAAGASDGVRAHYQFMGYEVFANTIEKLKATLSPEALAKKLRERFSDSVLIVDEVQNLRRVQNKYKGVSAALELVLASCSKVRLVLLTATPLFNDVQELIFIMEMLYLNDRNKEMLQRVRDPDFLSPRSQQPVHTPGAGPLADPVLVHFASRYVSYMRGENPYTFPLRLYPKEAVTSLKQKVDAFGRPLKPNGGDFLLPLVVSTATTGQRAAILERLDEDSLVHSTRLDISVADEQEDEESSAEDGEQEEGRGRLHQFYMQASNIVYPGEDGTPLVGAEGLRACLRSSKVRGGRTQYAYSDATLARAGPFLSPKLLPSHAPKLAQVVDAVCSARGVVIVYSRFIASGLLPIALALEHRGFLPHSGLPLWGVQHTAQHTGQQPTEGPAGRRYAVIAGDGDLAAGGSIDRLMAAVNSPQNLKGDVVKVVLISSRAAEGFDFKAVRQLHIVDPWFNLSRVEQIIGRGVRNCSHKLLPDKQRNCTIYLHACQLDKKREGIDAYMYRTSERKQRFISRIERVLKKNAVDCALNEQQLHYDSSQFPEEVVEDSQGNRRTVRRGDQDYSRACDFEKCGIKCSRGDVVAPEDSTTHAPFFDKPDIDSITGTILSLFRDEVSYSIKDIEKVFKGVRKDQLAAALRGAISSRAPVLHRGVPGHIIYRSDKFLFQPDAIDDTKLTIRERKLLLVMESVVEVLGEAADPDTVADMVVDGLNSDELAAVARHGTEPEFGQSLVRGGYICTYEGSDYLFDWHTMRYIDKGGEFVSAFKASQLLAKHRNSFDAAHRMSMDVTQSHPHAHPLGFTGAQGEESVFKLVDPKEKKADQLSGVTCTRYPQLKKQELLQMIERLAPDSKAGGSQVKRGAACLVYEYLLRLTGEPQFVRPVAHLFQKRSGRGQAKPDI
ncbi:hypothetical protein HXX76_014104 [Chlamydomonas incerta]|uniref:Helicase ATP-binding domain-containing protein n=1 Tax=Chlamydomonas incerta TaxID=51695 RepID=A0A835VTP8_CHLIN|nr:hypothetical protein HXX76_014104 [Chlamydomonas incerta]|eukprot:KAG2424946.1 hypothetical protein HXX76_014104 [Chlamydomonas incerta]